MKEFIEKLIVRLEEELIPLNQEITKYFYELKDTDNPKYIYAVGRSNALTDFKYTIKQLAKEYDGGWIPCSERLPDTEHISGVSEMVLVTTKNKSIFTAEYHKNGIWLDDVADWSLEVIAWQPLPPAYKE